MIRVRQIKVDVRKDSYDELINSLVRKLKVNSSDIVNVNIVKKSIDARHKDNVCYIYEVDVNLKNESLVKLGGDILKSVSEKYFLNLADMII